MKRYALFSLFFLLLFFLPNDSQSCSMFKITMHGKTMVGNNEDAWRLNSRIWFETGKNGHYGAMYLTHDDQFPQGGFNEAGLVFDGLTVYPRSLKPVAGKKAITDAGEFLKSIMQQCATVQEVRDLVNQYDRSVFNQGMLLFVDKSGSYLVVEVDTTIMGDDASYVLSNFCPSQTPDLSQVQIGRYIKGSRLLQQHQDTSLNFCVSVMDTMHECRNRIGDGTTYTSIYDLNAKMIYLYFYHDYKHVVSFSLQQELAKGDHILFMSALFPDNAEYIRFVRHKTPFNSVEIKTTLNAIKVLFLISFPSYFFIFFREAFFKRRLPLQERPVFIWPAWLILNLGLVNYLGYLSTNKTIFYFDAPYKDDNNWLLSLSSYFPLVLLLLIIPLIIISFRSIRRGERSLFYMILLTINTLSYIMLLGLFAYWGLIAV